MITSSLNPKNSAGVTIVVTSLFIVLLCYIILRVFALFSACSRLDTGSLDFELLFSCGDLLVQISIIALAVSVGMLFCVKKDNGYLNRKGLVWSRFIWLIATGLYIADYLY